MSWSGSVKVCVGGVSVGECSVLAAVLSIHLVLGVHIRCEFTVDFFLAQQGQPHVSDALSNRATFGSCKLGRNLITTPDRELEPGEHRAFFRDRDVSDCFLEDLLTQGLPKGLFHIRLSF